MRPTYTINRLAVLVFVFVALMFAATGMIKSVCYGDDALDNTAGRKEKERQNDGALSASFAKEISPIMQRNCGECHGKNHQEAGLRIDQLNSAMPSGDDVEAWSSIRDVLNSHQMPPPDEENQPTEQQRQEMVDWIDASFEQVAQHRRANRSSPMRRLTVAEYQNTLQELFGAEVPFAQNLPAAPLSEHGYSRDAALLSVSALELEYFLAIARQAVDDYVIFGAHIPESEQYLIEFEDVVYRPGVAGGYSTDKPLTQQELTEKRKARNDGQVVYSDRTLFPLPDGSLDLHSEELNRTDRQKFHQQFAKFKSSHLHKAGELIVKRARRCQIRRRRFGTAASTEVKDTSGRKIRSLPSKANVTSRID